MDSTKSLRPLLRKTHLQNATLGSVIQAVLADLKRDEGFRKKPYHDSLGLLTIGYGTLIENGITKQEGHLLLEYRLRQCMDELLARRPGLDFPPPVRRGLFNMAYNLGVPKLMRFQRMWAALDDAAYDRAAEEP